MAAGRVETADRMGWNHAAALCCVVANANRVKGRPLAPADFNPYESRRNKMPITKETIGLLAGMAKLAPGARKRGGRA